jgi:hypothetical protein
MKRRWIKKNCLVGGKVWKKWKRVNVCFAFFFSYDIWSNSFSIFCQLN